ncbi:MAG: L-aspartate oxidase [Lachnospiraceae bacterium]|nr:L-aspartate oxidase [Lachnospiraceae bacterium]
MKTDVLIAGSGCSGLYLALNVDRRKKITIITKKRVEDSDSFLAQGGMCMLKDPSDYDAYFEDTMKAGHYENDRESVEIMIRSSPNVVSDLLGYGVEFERDEDGNLLFTREGAHSEKRIIYHKDTTGQAITSRLYEEAKRRNNISIIENAAMTDLIIEGEGDDRKCVGLKVSHISDDGEEEDVDIFAEYTVLATGGIGGKYRHSTNFRHLTGDAIDLAKKFDIELKDLDYVQIHPTTFYSKNPDDRCFLISESVRGEGAKLYNKNMERFADELMPRDLLTEAILKQMEKDGTEFVWEDLRPIPREELDTHFPTIVAYCKKMGYDVYNECIPVVPAQHYFMGGIKVDHDSKTSMKNLFAVGETACNGVHGKNRLASNSLLESLVFAKRAAKRINHAGQ